MIYFHRDQWFFKISEPKYEIDNFGYKVAELRLINTPEKLKYGDISFSMNFLRDYLKQRIVIACTFRGEEDIKLVRYLDSLGFKFVGTFNTMKCIKSEFKEITIKSNLKTKMTTGLVDEAKQILNIEKKVFDYSSYQLDPDFPNEITAKRNVMRVKSYFGDKNHVIFTIKQKNKVLGFLQFIINKEKHTANCVNGAVDPEFQGMFVGPVLYSEAFNSIFNFGVNEITSGCSNQNIGALKIHTNCGFRIINNEIHLRLKL